MEVKAKHILAGLIIVILIGITFIYIRNKKGTIENDLKTLDEEKQVVTRIWDYEDSDSIVGILAQKNGDWSNLPLTDAFLQKYNEKDGIFKDINFDSVEYFQDEGDYYFSSFPYLIVTQGLKKTAYVFNVVAKDGLIDWIKFFDVCQLTDENGNVLDYRQPTTKDNFNLNMTHLTYGGDDEKGVGVTPNFHKKYPCFLDLFIHYSPLGSNEITFDATKSSWEEKRAYFVVDSMFECKKREYEVKFSLDDKGYLDDAEVKLISEKAYEKNKKDKASDAVFYKNSNWEYLKLTENFINRYKNKGTFFDDIEKVYISIPAIISIKCNDNWIGQYKYKDGSKHWFYENYIYDDSGYLDDAYFISIDYNGNSGEEAKEIYLNSAK